MRKPLRELAIRYFRKLGYSVEEDVELNDLAGRAHKVDMLIKKGDEVRPVWIRDWKRTVGVNVVINVDLEAEELDIGPPILVGTRFSERAKSYANRKGITLLTPLDLEL